METLGSEAARQRLPELLDRARRGEQTVIQKHGVPVAALVPLDQRLQPHPTSLLALRGSGRGCWPEDGAQQVEALRQEWPA
ncbi:MAG: type II toxin-antitoxin system prevent-host-death family antitoxin [Prochlorococcaceae cyanobacterium]